MKPVRSPARSSALRWLGLCFCTLALCLPALAMAQAPGALSAADRADIRAFTFNEDVLSRLQAVVAQARAMHIQHSRLDMSRVHSLDDMAAQMVAADPRVKPMLASHGFTPRQFLVANLALLGTVLPMQQAQGTAREKAVESHLNPANVRFYKSHKQAMQRLLHPEPATSGSTSP